MIRLKIEGMTCNHCVMHVKQALAATPGVQQVEVRLQPGEAIVEGTAELAALVAAVVEEGYQATVVAQ